VFMCKLFTCAISVMNCFESMLYTVCNGKTFVDVKLRRMNNESGRESSEEF